MQTSSSAFTTAIASNTIEPKAKVIIQTAGGTTYTLFNESIVRGSLSILSKCFDTCFSLGSCIMDELSFSFLNLDGAWNGIDLTGATAWPYSGLVLPDTTTEYIPLGTFIIDVPSRPYDQVSPIAHSRLVLLDTPFSDVVRAFPATVYDLLVAICSHCNIPVHSSVASALNMSYSITTRPAEEYTCRDVVSMLAFMCGCFVKTSRAGELQFVAFPALRTTPYAGEQFTMDVGSRFSFTQDTSQVTITGLQYRTAANVVKIGTEDYMVVQEDIPFIQSGEVALLQSIFATIDGFTYTGFTAEYMGNPKIDTGDVIKSITRDGQTITSLVTSHMYKHANKSMLVAEAQSKLEMSFTGANARRIAVIAAKVNDVEQELTTYQQAQAQFTDLLAQAMGYFVTEEVQEDGSIIHYEHDSPLLADSTVRYKKTATTMSWTPDAGAHWYGMDASGNIIARVLTIIGINADWITAGIIQSADGKTFFDLALAKIVATTRKLLYTYASVSHYEDTITQLFQGEIQVETKRDNTALPVALGNSVGLFSFKHSGDNGAVYNDLLKIQAAFRAAIGGNLSPQAIDISNTGVTQGADGTPTPVGSNLVRLRVWPPVEMMGLASGNINASKLLGRGLEDLFQSTYIASSKDANNYVYSGAYRYDTSISNIPAGLAFGQLLVVHGGADTVMQITSDFASGDIYWRSGNPTQAGGSGSWGVWRKIYHSGNIAKICKNTTGLISHYCSTAGWYGHAISFGVTYLELPLISVIPTTQFTVENISISSLSTTGAVLNVYESSPGFTFAFRWMAVGNIS